MARMWLKSLLKFIEPAVIFGEGVSCFAVMCFHPALGAAKMHGAFRGKFTIRSSQFGELLSHTRGMVHDEIVLQREKELGATRLSLPGGTSDELSIDPR